jgi:hypothetical protein
MKAIYTGPGLGVLHTSNGLPDVAIYRDPVDERVLHGRYRDFTMQVNHKGKAWYAGVSIGPHAKVHDGFDSPITVADIERLFESLFPACRFQVREAALAWGFRRYDQRKRGE